MEEFGYSGETNNKRYLVYVCPPKFIPVPVADLISKRKPMNKEGAFSLIDEQWWTHPFISSHYICATSRKFGPCLFLFPIRPFKLLHRYQLSTPAPTDSNEIAVANCKDMEVAATNFLSVQVGDGCFYVFSVSGKGTNKRLVLQKYDIDNDRWHLFPDSDNVFNDYCSEFVGDWVIYNISSVPHVVINHKLHLSLGGNYTFSFDTKDNTWERSYLFDTFWSINRFSPSKFYGGPVWNSESGTSKPFGFYETGVHLCDDVLLGIHQSEECQLVAFLLDGDDKAIRSQPIAFTDQRLLGARLVDLGRDGYIGLMHLTYGRMVRGSEERYRVELVIFKFTSLDPSRNDNFLQIDSVEEYILGKEYFSQAMAICSNAFCV